MRRLCLIALVLLPLLAGCDEDVSPLVSVEVTDQGLRTERGYPKTWKLAEAQLKPLAVWLHAHDSEGNLLLMTPPPPSLVIRLNHVNGRSSHIELFSANENWKRAVVVGTPGTSRIKAISLEERETLLQLVKEMPDG